MQAKNELCSEIVRSRLMSVHKDDIKNGVFHCPDGVESIEKNAFASHEHLITIVNLNGVKQIEDEAFKEFPNLTTVFAPEAQTIGCAAFLSCEKLLSINVPKATALGWFAIENCSSLTTINAPQLHQFASITSMECEKLVTLNLSKVKSLYLNPLYVFDQLTTLILHPKVEIRFIDHTDSLSYRCKNLKQIIIHNFDNTPFNEEDFISRLPPHLQKTPITLASEIVEHSHYIKKALKQHVALGDVERQIFALYPQLFFSPSTIQKPSKTEQAPSPSSII